MAVCSTTRDGWSKNQSFSEAAALNNALERADWDRLAPVDWDDDLAAVGMAAISNGCRVG
jgi:hypothetical protein